MKKWMLEIFVGSGWAGVFMAFGAIIAYCALDYRLEHYRLQDQINKMDDQRGVVCIAEGKRMECRFQRMTDPGV